MPITGSVSGSVIEFSFGYSRATNAQLIGFMSMSRSSPLVGKYMGPSTYAWANFIPFYRTEGMGLNSVLSNKATQSLSVGNPYPPSLELHGKTFHRFRWALTSGDHTIRVNALQAYSSSASDRPSIYITQNQAIGITSSIEVFADTGSAGWTTIGPVPLTSTTKGGVWVELRSNCTVYHNNPCYFDTIVTT